MQRNYTKSLFSFIPKFIKSSSRKFLYLILLSWGVHTTVDAQTITLQPSDYPFCNTATFGEFWVGATNVSTYQWQRTNDQTSTPAENAWINMTEGETFYGGTAAGVATRHLTLTGINNTLYSTDWSPTANPPAGVRFRCVITPTAGNGSAVNSNPATLVRNNVAGSAPSITTQPADKIVCIAPNGPSFPTTSTGGTSYLWEYRSEPVPGYGTDPARTWRGFSNPGALDGNIYNGGNISARVSGAATQTLVVGPLNYTLFIDYDNYVRLKVSNSCGSVYTNQALLRVWDNYALSTALDTQNKKVCAGGSASFNVVLQTTTGQGGPKKFDPPTSYQWEIENTAFSFPISNGIQNSSEVGITGNGTTYNGQGTTGLSMSNITRDLNGSKVVLFIRQAVCTGGTTSATLLVDYPPVFNNLTGKMTVCTGQTSSPFIVDASGNNLTYRYLVSTDGGQNYPQDTNLGTAATVTLPQSYIGQKIKVEITNLCGTVTSPAQDIVRGDCFTPSIIYQPNNYPFCNGATFGEFWVGAANASTYRWQRSVLQTNSESDWTDIVENENFYGGTATGAATNHLSLTGVSAYPTEWSYGDPKGISFRCVVTSATGSVVKSNAALLVKTDRADSAPSIGTQPPAKTIRCDNETNAVTLAAAATNATSYQWQVKAESDVNWTDIPENGAPGSAAGTSATHTGTTSPTISINNVQDLYWKTLHYYRNKVTNSCGSVYTYLGSYQTLTRPTIAVTPTPATDVCAPASATFTATLTGGNLPSNFSYEWKRKSPSGTLYSVADGTQNNADSPAGASVGNGTVYSNVATGAMSISNAPATLNGYSFEVTVKSPSCISSSNTTGLVGAAQGDILISTLPEATSNVKADLSGNPKIYICEGTTTGYQLTVAATGNNLHYQYWTGSTNFVRDTGLADAASVTLGTSYVGTNIKVKVLNACGTKELGPYSIESTPTAIPPIPSTGNPAASSTCSGTNTSFSVTGASGKAYPQWQISSDNTTWTDLTDGVNAGSTTSYAGTNSTSLAVNNAAVANNNFYYRLKAYTDCAAVYSGSAQLTVYAPVAVTGGNETKSICNGEALELTAQATGGELKYRWQKDGRDLVGGTGSTYRKNEVSAGDEGTYTVIVSGACGQPQTNQAAVVSVRTITITAPTNNSIVTKCAGEGFTTSVQASGQSLNYRWMKDGVPIVPVAPATANAATYSIPSVAPADAGVYTCEVGSGLCSNKNITRGFELKVGAGITKQPTAGQTICPGSTLNLSVEAGGGSGALSYQWTKDGNNIAGATTAAYSKPGTTIADNGRYAVVVTGSCGTATSKEAVVIVSKELEIFQHPVSTTLCVGKDGSLGAFGTEGALGQWQFKQGSSWVPVANGTAANGTVYAGATTNTLQFSKTTAAAAGIYRCRIYNTCKEEKFTNEAVVSVSTGGVPITQQPSPQTVCAGGNINLSVTATGNNLKYQWTKDGLNVGTNASTFTKTAATGDQGIYQVNVMDGCASTLSNPVQVSMGVGIDVPPQSQTICPSGRLSLSVTVSGSGPFTPQWFKDGSSIAGANLGTYTVDSMTAGDAGNYTVRVTGSCGSVTSPAAVVSLGVGFNSALPSDMTVCNGGTANFKVEATGPNLTYQWQYLNNGSTWTNATNTNIQGSLWTGTTTTQVSIADVTNAFYDGLKIRCLVKSTCTGSNPLPSRAATLSIGNTATSITTQPKASQALCTGQEYFVTVVPGGLGTFSYNWKKNGTAIGVTTADLKISKVTTADAGTYTVDITSSCSTTTVVTSSDAVLIVGKMAIEIAPAKSLVKCNGSDLSLLILTSGITPFQYRWTLNGNLLSSTSSEHVKRGITKDDAGIYEVTVSSASCPDGVSAQSTVTVTNGVVTQPPAKQSGCYGGNVTLPVETVGNGLTFQWFKDNVELPGQVQSSLHLTNLKETDQGNYTLKVGSPGCEPLPTSSTALTISKLSLTTNLPGTVEQCGGSNNSLVLTVVPKGTAPFSYQWKKNTNDIEGAVGSTYSIVNPRAQDGGTYSVTVNDLCLTPLNSESAEVKINSSIEEQPSEETTVCNNSFRLHAKVTNTPATYQWKKNGENIPGATTDTYQNDNANTDDSGIYTVEVTSQTPSCGTVTMLSNDAYVAVGAGIRTQPQTQSVCLGGAMKMKVESFAPKGTTFIWKKDGQIIPGETKNTYEIAAPPGVETTHQGIYTVEVRNSCGSITSNKANLYVGPGIAKQPENTEACLGLEANIEVVAAGSNPTYKWYKNGVLMENQTSSILHFDQVTDDDLATYVVKVNTCATDLTSNEVTLKATSGGYFATGKISTNPPYAIIKYGEKIDFKYEGPDKNVLYAWNFGDGSFVSTDKNPVHYYYKTGDINVQLHVSVSGTTCEKDIKLATIVEVNDPGVDIYTGDQKNHNLTAHPVPFTTELIVENTTTMNRVRLVALQGIEVISQSCNSKKVSLSTENLASGIYIVIIETNEGVMHIKVMK